MAKLEDKFVTFAAGFEKPFSYARHFVTVANILT
jgi:hypothetical protein